MDQIASLIANPVVRTLADIFTVAGEQLYLVGGSVRDLFSTGGYDDLDFATSAHPDRTLELVSHLGATWDAGRNFGTIGVEVLGQKCEVTTFRTDTYDRQSRKPEVQFANNLLDDLLRRDFTINAMAIDVTNGELVDPFDGRKDMRFRTLRTPLNANVTIKDDPLRSLRAIRFAVTRNMLFDYHLAAAITRNADALAIVSQERKTAELMKIAAAGIGPLNQAIEYAQDMGVEHDLFGSLAVDPVDAADFDTPDPLVALACVSASTPIAEAALLAMKFPKDDARRVGHIIDLVHHLRTFPISPFGSRRLVRIWPDDVLRPAMDILRHRYGKTEPLMELALHDATKVRAPLPVNGDDFVAAGLVGPAIGRALSAVEYAYLQHLELSRDDAMTVGLAAAGV